MVKHLFFNIFHVMIWSHPTETSIFHVDVSGFLCWCGDVRAVLVEHVDFPSKIWTISKIQNMIWSTFFTHVFFIWHPNFDMPVKSFVIIFTTEKPIEDISMF